MNKYPNLYMSFSKIYRKIIYPLITGHFQYYCNYNLFIKKNEINKLKSYGFSDINPINYREWRIGKGKDGAYRRYYLAQYKSQKCFIKIGTNDMTVANELNILKKLKDSNIEFSPTYVIGDNYFKQDTVMIAVKYLEGLKKFTIPSSISEFEDICTQFLNILDLLEQNNILHADVHQGNLMLFNQKLYLLDYGISMVVNDGNEIDYISRPGTFYIEEDGYRKYDDAFSFNELLKKQGLKDEFLDCKSYKEVKNRVGKFILKIKL